MGPVAIAADGGGSIRIPASFCGLFGMKASMGRVPMYPCCRDERYPGIASWEGLEHVGPVSRTVADSALVLSVIAGPDDRDRHSIPAGDVDWRAAAQPGDLRGLRVAYSADLGRVAVDPEVARVVGEAVGAFAELGCEVEAADPDFHDPGAAFAALIALESDLTGMRELVARHGHEMSPHLVDLITREWRAEDFTDAQTFRKAVVNAMWRFMRDYDLLVTPTLTTPPFAVHMQGPSRSAGATCATRRGCRSPTRSTSPASRPRRCPPASPATGCRSGCRSSAAISPTASCCAPRPRSRRRARGRSTARRSTSGRD